MNKLPNGWMEASLETIVDILDSKRIPLNSTEREQRISGKNIEQLYPYYGATGQVGLIDGYLFDGEYVLLGEDGVPFLDPMRPKAYRVHGKFWVNNHAHVLKAINGLSDNRLVESYLNVFNYKGFVTGSTRLKLTQAAMRSISIPLPPLNEQKRIADKLDSILARIDACRERLDRIPAILKRFRQAILAAATSGKLTEEWRENSCNESSWQEINVGELLIDIRYGTAKKCHYEPQATPVIRIPNICDGKISHANLKYAEFDDDERQKLSLDTGDILMIRSNGSVDLVGRTALATEADAGFLYAGYLIRLRVNQQIVNPAYLSLALSAPDARHTIELTARSTSGVNNINTEEIKVIGIKLPNRTEQTEIVRRVEKLFAYADRIEARYHAARARVDKLTPAILAKAFRGELVPQNPDDEPASVLLDRIRASRAANAATSKPERRRNRGAK